MTGPLAPQPGDGGRLTLVVMVVVVVVVVMVVVVMVVVVVVRVVQAWELSAETRISVETKKIRRKNFTGPRKKCQWGQK